MSTLPADAPAQEMEGELMFYRVLMDTLDPDDEEFEQRKEEYENIIADYENKLHTLHVSQQRDRPHTPAQAQRSNGFNGIELPSRESNPNQHPSSHLSPLAHRVHHNDSSEVVRTNHLTGHSPRSTTPSPSSGALNLTNKRPRESWGFSHLDPFNNSRKARRTGDSADTSTASTPATEDSLEQAENALEMSLGLDLTSARENMMKRFQEQQREHEARLKREQDDERFAKQLEEQEAQSRNRPQYTTQYTTQSLLDTRGQMKRPTLAPMPAVPDTSIRYASSQWVKAESRENGVVGNSSFSSIAPSQQHSSMMSEAGGVKPSVHSNAGSSLSKPSISYTIDDDDDELLEITPAQFAASMSPDKSRASLLAKYAGVKNTSRQHAASSVMNGYVQNGYIPASRRNPMTGGTSVYGSTQAVPIASLADLTAPQSMLSAALNGISAASSSVREWYEGFEPLASAMDMISGLGGGNPALMGNDMTLGIGGSSARPDHFNEDIHARGWDYMLNDPSKTREELEQLLENIRPDEDIPPEMRIGTPEALSVSLMEHQKLGLAWLKAQEEGSNKGGILADDMGLGKTIQALSLIVSRPSTDRARKTTLIVAPVALLRQWEKEIKDKLKKQHRLKVFIFHGPKKMTFARLSQYDVVLTTFGKVAGEYNRKLQWELRRKGNPNAVPRDSERLVLLAEESRWYRVIIDEAQCIKNKSTKAAMGCCYLISIHRLCMTGTPMMNNVGELYSLIHFLRIQPYNNLERFNKDFKSPLSSQGPFKERAMKALQALLKAILLRRTKKSTIDGVPILNIPERTTEIVHAVFSPDERDFYTALETEARLQVNKYLKAGKIGRNYSYILVRLLRLRQACCHPHLIKDFAEDGPGEMTKDDMKQLARDLGEDVVARIKGTEGQFECPICYDASENPTIFFPCGHDVCSECFARMTDPSQAIANGTDGQVDAKCPECRSKLDPKKVLNWTSFKQVHLPEQGFIEELPEEDIKNEMIPDETESETDDDEDDDEEDESDANSQGDLRDFIVDDDEEEEPGSDGDEDTKDAIEGDEWSDHERQSRNRRKSAGKETATNANSRSRARETSKGKGRGKGKVKGKGKKKDKKTLADLKKEGMRNAAAKKRYLRRLRKDWIVSAKIEKTLEILRDVRDRNTGEKTIIFSQFTSLLDLVEVPIDELGWGYRRYDGSMSAKLRNEAVEQFTDKPDVRVMLVSLKAGNAGLNLTAASQVIILDPFWNPFIEEQAIDRAHRIGQQRPVQVHRVLVENTVEDRIIALQEKKRDLINQALDEKAGQSLSRLGRAELAYLFGITPTIQE